MLIGTVEGYVRRTANTAIESNNGEKEDRGKTMEDKCFGVEQLPLNWRRGSK